MQACRQVCSLKRCNKVRLNVGLKFQSKKNIHEADVILIGPQIRYELPAVKEIAGDIPVEAIDMRDYGMMNGPKVLDQALALIGE